MTHINQSDVQENFSDDVNEKHVWQERVSFLRGEAIKLVELNVIVYNRTEIFKVGRVVVRTCFSDKRKHANYTGFDYLKSYKVH